MFDFDLCYKWFGIPPQEQPLNHARFVALESAVLRDQSRIHQGHGGKVAGRVVVNSCDSEDATSCMRV